MTVQTRVPAALALLVTLVGAGLAAGALLGDGSYADSRVIALCWLLAPAVGLTAYLSTRWGVAATGGAAAAVTAGVVASGQAAAWPAAVIALAVGVGATLLGDLARRAERHEHDT